MISSSDDLKLFLKKLESESARVGIIASVRAGGSRLALIYIEGQIGLDEKLNVFHVAVGQGQIAFAAVEFTGCQFGYGRFNDLPELENWHDSPFDSGRYDECLVIGRPDGSRVILLTVAENPATHN